MAHKPSRLYTGADIAAGVQTVHQLGVKALQIAPHAAGPLSMIPTAGPGGDVPLVHKHHCMGCGGPSEFEEEGREKMANGTHRVFGKDAKGHKMSKFISGAADGTG